MKEYAERISGVAEIARMPKLEGRHMIMILVPRQDKPVKAEKESQPQQQQA